MKRNAFVFILTALMVCSFGLANAQDALDITGDPTGIWGSGTVNTDADITWTLHMTVATDIVKGHTNGFRVFLSSDGTVGGEIAGTFTPMTYAVLVDMVALGDDGGFFDSPFGIDGLGADTVGFGGFALFKGIPNGTDLDVYTITTQVPEALSETGTYLCLDSSFYPPGGAWLWSLPSTGIQPFWGGPYCYLIEKQPNVPAVFTNCAGAALVTASHTAVATYDFDGFDEDPEMCPPGGLTFGGADIDAGSGVWAVAGNLGLVGAPISATVSVADPCGDGEDCVFSYQFTNLAPTADCGGNGVVGKGNTYNKDDIVGVDPDGDPIQYSIDGVSPAPAGTYGIDANTGDFFFATDESDCGVTGMTYTFTIRVTDGVDFGLCSFEVDVLCTEPFELQISKEHDVYQGMHRMVDVTVNKGSEDMLGFDILIAYDASALAFQTALEGDIYALCGWEYFTYRYNYNGNCGNGCPTGLLRVVGMAETNNGPNHPDCSTPVGGWVGQSLFSLDFLVTDDRTFECMYVPIRFYWYDCGDNAIAFHEKSDVLNPYSVQTAISRFVFDYDYAGEITDPLFGFPTYFGAQEICMEGDKDVPVRFADFINGGIDIICADSIDGRGDINTNGIMNEIADAVLYTNYFVYGLGVFDNYQAQVAASDVNADGITLSVADLVYQIRIIIGDANPYPKLAPVDASITFGDAIAVDSKMGAAYVVIDGNAAPELLADNMELRYAYDADEDVTRALVYSMNADQTFEGEFMNANGTVVSIELATYEGTPVKVDMVPTNFSLNQNYPNPFNPKTTVAFTVTKVVDYTLSVYNITGQEVASFSGIAEVGVNEVDIDGANWSSGIYFYKLNAGDFSDTKKMVMVK